jgi:hypothetical protein
MPGFPPEREPRPQIAALLIGGVLGLGLIALLLFGHWASAPAPMPIPTRPRAEAHAPSQPEPPAAATPATPAVPDPARPPAASQDAADAGAAPFSAQPFGLRSRPPSVGDPVAGSTDTEVALPWVPHPHPAFHRYSARFGPAGAPCRLTAASQPLTAAADGAALRRAFNALQAELDEAYGAHARTDILLAEATFEASEQWMAALAAGQRRLLATWHALSGASLPPQLSRVVLRAEAETATTGRLRLELLFADTRGCAESATDGGQPADAGNGS